MTKEELMYEKKTVYKRGGKALTDAAYEYAKGYMQYLDAGKTEREALNVSVEMCKKAGYRE